MNTSRVCVCVSVCLSFAPLDFIAPLSFQKRATSAIDKRPASQQQRGQYFHRLRQYPNKITTTATTWKEVDWLNMTKNNNNSSGGERLCTTYGMRMNACESTHTSGAQCFKLDLYTYFLESRRYIPFAMEIRKKISVG